jgi:hypothetical protein
MASLDDLALALQRGIAPEMLDRVTRQQRSRAMPALDRGGRAGARMPAVGYGAAWLQAFLNHSSGLSFDSAQATRIAALAERKLVDLFDVAEEIALANGRTHVLRHDLPLTRGLRARLGEVERLAVELEPQPLLVFLADAGVPGPLDERVRAELPRLMAAPLLLTGRIIAVLEPEAISTEERLERLLRPTPEGPTRWKVERAERVLNMTI